MFATDKAPGPGPGGVRVTRRLIQRVLGAFWLLDGLLQFQPFMFGKGFLTQIIEPMAQGQPEPVARAIQFMAGFAQPHLTVWNALFATTQVLIGLGLLVSRRTVKPALVASFVWAFIVWWFGEGFGMLLTGQASPLTGAPGAVVLYALIGLVVWPTGKPEGRSAASGGLLGDTGGRAAWAVLWILLAGLMLQPANRTAGASSSAFSGLAAGSPGPVQGFDGTLAHAAAGRGLGIAVVLAVLMVVVGVGVFLERFRNHCLLLGALLSLFFWVTAQAFGGMFTGSGTDPNAGPLIALLALALYRRPVGEPDRAERPRPGFGPSPGATAHN